MSFADQIRDERKRLGLSGADAVKPHGGRRKGAGAKLKGKARRVTRSINLEPDSWRRLDAIAAAQCVSASEIVNRWVADHAGALE